MNSLCSYCGTLYPLCFCLVLLVSNLFKKKKKKKICPAVKVVSSNSSKGEDLMNGPAFVFLDCGLY